MTLRRPIWMQAGGGDSTFEYSAQEVRAFLSAITAQEGVYWGLDVTQRGAGANFSVDIAAGEAVIAGDDVSQQGHYVVYNTAGAYNVTVPAAPVSGSRTHRVIAQVMDKLHEGTWTDYEWDVILQEDTGSGTPALPDSAIPLAEIAVTSATVSITSANITDKRATALMHPSLDKNVGSDATRPAAPTAGQRIWRTDKGYYETWNGSAWKVKDFLSSPVSASSETDQTTTSTSFAAGSTQVSTTFVAPPSGIVYVTVSGTIECEAASSAYLGYEIRNDTVAGSVVQATDDRRAFAVQGDNSVQGSFRKAVTGLTAGNTYFIRTMLRTSNGASTAQAVWREIIVEPHGS